jgi:flagellar assembly protein FliH
MSCKVLTSQSALAFRPLFLEAEAESEPAVELIEETDIPEEQVPASELIRLQERIAELERTLPREVKLAREAGWRDGEQAGRETAAADLKPVLDRLARGIADIATLRPRIRRETESDLVTLSIAIARRLLRRELTVDPDAIQGLVKAALEKVQLRDVCKVRIHPEHQASIRRLVDRGDVLSALEIAPDAGLDPGDVVIETRRGDLDGTIESQLSEIERGFADRLGR